MDVNIDMLSPVMIGESVPQESIRGNGKGDIRKYVEESNPYF